MGEPGDTIPLIEGCLARLAAGDEKAWDELMVHAFDRLLAQCRRILGRELSRPNPLVTENAVLAEAYIRLQTALRNDTAKPATAAEFFGLTARNIRWHIQDMLRKPSGFPDEGGAEPAAGGPGVSTTVENRELWQKFWDAVGELTDEEQRVFDLLWVNELSQYEAATVLGIDRNRVDTLWRRVKLKIGKACQDFMPLPP